MSSLIYLLSLVGVYLLIVVHKDQFLLIFIIVGVYPLVVFHKGVLSNICYRWLVFTLS